MALLTFADARESYRRVGIEWYLASLYRIELLRNANIDNIDLMVAWQYGQEYLKPWKDNPYLIEDFFHTHHGELRLYVNNRFLRIVQTLINGLDIIMKPDLFTMTPLEPEIANSITAGMDDIISTGDFEKRLLDEYKADTSKPNSTIRVARGNFTGFEVIDRLLCGVFDKFPELARELDDKKEKKLYGVHRHEILENKVYLCAGKLKEILGRQIGAGCCCTENLYTNLGAWACIFSMLYRLRVPIDMHPNRMDTLYDKYILRHPLATEAIEKMRPYSTLTVEAVADDKLPAFNPEFIQDTVLKQRYSIAATYPSSLVEKYLVTAYLTRNIQFV